MNDLRIRFLAGLGWLAGVGITIFLWDVDWRLGMGLLGVGGWMCGGVFTAMSCHRDAARMTRKAMYQQRRWSDQPTDHENVVSLR